MTLKTLGAAALLSACALSAQAGTLSFDTGFSGSTLDVTGRSLSLSRFDSAFGTLTAADLVLTASLLVDAGVENTSDNPATGQLVISANLFAQERAGGLAFVELAPTETVDVDLAGFDGTLDYAGPSGTSVTGQRIKDRGTQTILDTETLATLTGRGDLTFDFESFGQIDAIGTSRFATGLQSFGSGALAVSLAVTYTYEEPAPSEVSLPASFPIFALALIGIYGWSRRKG